MNGESVGFDAPIADGDRDRRLSEARSAARHASRRAAAAAGRCAPDCVSSPTRIWAALAQLLRLAGFDTRYDNNFPDDEIEQLALDEHRIVLTRDRELLKRRTVMHGCYVRTLQADAQLREIFERLDLAPQCARSASA